MNPEECSHPPLHGALAHPEELVRCVLTMHPLPIPPQDGNIFSDDRMQELSTDSITRLPDVFECCCHIRCVERLLSSFVFMDCVAHLEASEFPYRRLAMHSRYCRDRIENLGFPTFARSPIFPAVLLEYLDSGCHSHGNYGNPYMSYPLLSW